MNMSLTVDRQKEFVALDNPQSLVRDEAFRMEECCDGMLMEMAVVDPTRMFLIPDLRSRIQKFTTYPWHGGHQAAALSRSQRRLLSFAENETRPVNILRALINTSGNIAHAECVQAASRVRLSDWSQGEMWNEKYFQDMCSLAMRLSATGEHGKKGQPKSACMVIATLLVVASKAFAKIATEKKIPVIHTNRIDSCSASFDRSFKTNMHAGKCPDGYVQGNAPLRRGTDLINAVNLGAEKPIFTEQTIDKACESLNQAMQRAQKQMQKVR